MGFQCTIIYDGGGQMVNSRWFHSKYGSLSIIVYYYTHSNTPNKPSWPFSIVVCIFMVIRIKNNMISV